MVGFDRPRESGAEKDVLEEDGAGLRPASDIALVLEPSDTTVEVVLRDDVGDWTVTRIRPESALAAPLPLYPTLVSKNFLDTGTDNLRDGVASLGPGPGLGLG